MKSEACEYTQLRVVHDASWRHVATRRDKISGRKVEVPVLMPTEIIEEESRFNQQLPVLKYLNDALELAGQHELADFAAEMTNSLSALRWSQNPSYNESNCSQSFLDGYAYAAISGPQGPIQCSAPRGGIMLMGPDVMYHDHKHAPREIYLVLTPGTQWRLDGTDWFDVEPGDLIYHESWQMHAMRTHAHPMLAFAGWLDPGLRIDIGFDTVQHAPEI